MIAAVWLLLLLISPVLRGQQLPSLAIIDFEALGISAQEAGILTSRLGSHIVRLNVYRAIERAQIEEILAEQDFQLTGCTSDECAVQIGQLLGAQFILAGTFGKLGETYSIDLRIIDVETGSILRTASYDVRGEIDHVLTAGIPQAARQIAGLSIEEDIPFGEGVDQQGNAVLRIESQPKGAFVKVGEDTLGTTPLQTSTLTPERNIHINVSLAGFHPQDTTVVLEAGKETNLNMGLMAIMGWLNIEGEVGARIALNGEKIGRLPLDKQALPIGTYTLTARMPEYHALMKGLEIGENQETALTIQMDQKPRFRAIALSGLFPGTGQLYMGYRFKGLVLMLCSAALAYEGYREHNDAVSAYQKYKRNLDIYNSMDSGASFGYIREEMKHDFSVMENHLHERNLLWATLGGLWFISLVDISF
jgi:TolB-like protein